MLESIFDDMLKSKVLSPDKVALAEAADAFVTQNRASLSVVVAAKLMAAIYRLLRNVNAVKARRKWVLQENTRFGINYRAVLRVGNVANEYIGLSARACCNIPQLKDARWGDHFYDLSTDKHCNSGFQRAFSSASLPAPAHGRTPHSRVVTGRVGPCRKGDPATGAYTKQLHPGGGDLTRAQFVRCFSVVTEFRRGDHESYDAFYKRVSDGEDLLIHNCARDCRASGGSRVCLNISGNQFPAHGGQGSGTGGGGGGGACVNCQIPSGWPSPLCLHHEPACVTAQLKCYVCGQESRDGTCPTGDRHISLRAWKGMRATIATCHSGTTQGG